MPHAAFRIGTLDLSSGLTGSREAKDISDEYRQKMQLMTPMKATKTDI